MTSIPRTCRLDYCTSPTYKRGLCSLHYDRARRGVLIVEGVTFPPCSEPDCERPRYGKGLCHRHYHMAKGQTAEGKTDRDKRNREWHSRNKERVSERKRKQREADPDKFRERARAFTEITTRRKYFGKESMTGITPRPEYGELGIDAPGNRTPS